MVKYGFNCLSRNFSKVKCKQVKEKLVQICKVGTTSWCNLAQFSEIPNWLWLYKCVMFCNLERKVQNYDDTCMYMYIIYTYGCHCVGFFFWVPDILLSVKKTFILVGGVNWGIVFLVSSIFVLIRSLIESKLNWQSALAFSNDHLQAW